MRLWVLFSLLATGSILIVFGFTMGLLVEGWKRNVEDAWKQSSSKTLLNVKLIIEEHLNTVVFASKGVPTLSDHLLSYYVHYERDSGYKFNSIGYLMRAPGTSNGKLSWQIADYKAACPIYGYYLSNETIHPSFLGYCSTETTIDFGTVAYTGVDWGLKPEEASIIDDQLDETFLPVHDLLGAFTLTYEVARSCANNIRCVSFAEIGLSSMASFIKNNITSEVNVYIVDNNTEDILVGTPKHNQYQSTFEITDHPGLDWTIYVEHEDIYNDMYYRIGISCGICAAVAVVVWCLFIWLFILVLQNLYNCERKDMMMFNLKYFQILIK